MGKLLSGTNTKIKRKIRGEIKMKNNLERIVPEYSRRNTEDGLLPSILPGVTRATKITRLTCGEPFKTYNLHKNMKLEGIDLYFQNRDVIIGKLRYIDGELKYYLTKGDGKVNPVDDNEWTRLDVTVLNDYIEKRRKEGNVLPIIEEDPTKDYVAKNIANIAAHIKTGIEKTFVIAIALIFSP